MSNIFSAAFTDIESFFSKLGADIEALAKSPVGLTIDSALATAAGVAGAIAIVNTVGSSNKAETANDILVIEAGLAPLASDTAAPTSDQISAILTALKANTSTDSVIFQTIAGMFGTQILTITQTYDGTPWATVLGSVLNGFKYGALAMGGTAPAPVTTPATTA